DAELLQTIPGIGPQTAATLLGELGALTRFTDARALVAYVGFYPVINESGDRAAPPRLSPVALVLRAILSTSPPSMPCAVVASGAPFISVRRPRAKPPSKRWSWSPSSCFMRCTPCSSTGSPTTPHVSSSRRRRLGLDISWDVSVGMAGGSLTKLHSLRVWQPARGHASADDASSSASPTLAVTRLHNSRINTAEASSGSSVPHAATSVGFVHNQALRIHMP